jgi:hypothetical protein
MPSPLDILFNNLRRGVEKSAQDLLRDFNREAQKAVRELARASVRGYPPSQPLGPLPKAHKPPPKGRSKGPDTVIRHTPTTYQMTLYDVLEVSPRASHDTLSAAFRSLSARFHPDNKKTGNEGMYKDITAAWTVLKNPEKRKRYDREIGLVSWVNQ